jgi:hypothetical protein
MDFVSGATTLITEVPAVKITSGEERMASIARVRVRSTSPPPQR